MLVIKKGLFQSLNIVLAPDNRVTHSLIVAGSRAVV